MSDFLFGSVAVRQGFATPEQVDSCLAQQKASPTPERIGDILVSRGYLTPEKVAVILEIQRVLIADRMENPLAGLFGQIAVQAGFCTAEALNAGARRQGELAAQGHPVRIGQILMRAHRLSQAHFVEVLRRQDRYLLKCSGCATWYFVEGAGAASKFFCRTCLRILPIPILSGSSSDASQFVELEAQGRPATRVSGETGDRFGPFLIESQLERTNAAILFYAVHRPTGARVNLRFLRVVRLPSPRELAAFRRTAAVLTNLSSPAIARLIDAGEIESHPYVATEHLERPTLAEAIAQREVKRLDLLRFLEKVGRIVAHAHREGAVHGGLRPSTILIGHRSEPRILDFGLAPLIAAQPFLKRDSRALGPYTAPEVLRGRPADRRSDVFSLGAIIYEILGGRLPTSVRASADLREPLPTERLDPLTLDVPADWGVICAEATAASPRDRCQSVEELADQMLRAIEGRPLAPRVRPPRRWFWPF